MVRENYVDTPSSFPVAPSLRSFNYLTWIYLCSGAIENFTLKR